jgi:late competence protein required for DNA uptake (superfamily II DNA/RNA helicase)
MKEKIIPKKKLVSMRLGHSKAVCEGCNKTVRVRFMIRYKGKYLCNNCMQKTASNKQNQSVGKYIDDENNGR